MHFVLQVDGVDLVILVGEVAEKVRVVRVRFQNQFPRLEALRHLWL